MSAMNFPRPSISTCLPPLPPPPSLPRWSPVLPLLFSISNANHRAHISFMADLDCGNTGMLRSRESMPSMPHMKQAIQELPLRHLPLAPWASLLEQASL